ncbi:MAG: Hpt domain-containing protein [Elusimicrobiota bacterium]
MDKEYRIEADPEIADLIPGYLARRRKELPRLAAACVKGDFKAIRTVSHKIRGSAGGYGCTDLVGIAGGLEDAARAGDGDAVRGGLRALTDYLDRVRVGYD